MMLLSVALRASEGMWIPALLKALNESDMKAMGLKLSAEDIYSINKSSLKDAIVHFGGGCTAEVISTEGLILTNHHCGFSQIQSHSSVEHDYLKDGFWAKSKSEELANPGLTATFIVRIEDVTDRVMKNVGDKDGPERSGTIQMNISAIEKETEANEKGHSASIRPFFYGNEYYMIVTKTYTDVRLVGAPPSSIGKYGGDTDNWMWPRHTGDFSMFRIYAGADNEPAAYSESNVPYKPRHSLAISLKGTQPGDFTMVYGFPGRTQQFLHSSHVGYITQVMNPAAIAMRDRSLDIIDATMASSDALRIKYAAKQARIANSWKKWQGENNGLERLNAIEKKRQLEEKFAAKIRSSKDLQAKYGKVLETLNGHVETGKKLITARSMLIEFFFVGPEVLRYARGFENLVENYEAMVASGKAEDDIKRLQGNIPGFFKNYHAPTDEKILAALYPMYIKNLAPEMRPALHKELQAKYKGDWNRYAADLFAKSYFTDEKRVTDLLANFNKGAAKKVKKDPAYILSKAVMGAWRENAAAQYQRWFGQMEEVMRIYVDGLMTVFPDKKYWPDANSTLRVAFGKVEGSEPRDGVIYNPFTTLDGVVAKYVPGDREFDLPQKLLDLQRRRDYGQYADANGDLPVCFTASNHTTGGNSGSPVIDGEGRLIGLNFDRSWESTMSDIMYDPERCRNIIVDIRYVMWVVDKYAGAKNLISEMNFVK